MTEKTTKMKVGGKTYVREEPSTTVKKEALCYVMYRSPFEGFMSFEPTTPHGTLSQFPLQGRSKLESKLGPWDLQVFESSASELEAVGLIHEVAVRDERADWMTDIALSFPMSLVRKDVKEFIEEFDPQGSLFFPTRIIGRDSKKEIEGGPYFQWMPKRRLFLPLDYKAPPGSVIPETFVDGKFGADGPLYQFQNNPLLREWMSKTPCFSVGFDYQVGFNAALFKALKSEGFTGLVEREHDGDRWAKDNINWNVGHIE